MAYTLYQKMRYAQFLRPATGLPADTGFPFLQFWPIALFDRQPEYAHFQETGQRAESIRP
jgi:hypothetical protein